MKLVTLIDWILYIWNFIVDFSNGKDNYVKKIDQISIPDTSYANSILSSTVSEVLEGNDIMSEFLTATKILELRNQAVIKCNEDKNPDTEYSASMKTPVLFNIINDPCEYCSAG